MHEETSKTTKTTPLDGMQTIRANELMEMEMDESHFKPFTLDMIYQCEPELKTIMQGLKGKKHQNENARRQIYSNIKKQIDKLIGDNAADPRLRSSEAWDCYTDTVLHELAL